MLEPGADPRSDPADRPLAGVRFAVAGPGRVGRSFARWAEAAGAELAFVVRRTVSSGAEGRVSDAPEVSFDDLFADPFEDVFENDAFKSTAAGDSADPDPPAVDVLLLTVSDAALAPVAASWADSLAEPPPFRAVLHSSGCFDAEILAPLRRRGVSVGSLHPLRAFADVVPAPGPNPFFAVDGDPEALSLARRFVRAWGGTSCELAGERRVVYHLAASLAAGGVVTTLAAITELMQRAELPDEVLDGYLELLRGAVDAAERAAAEGGPTAVASAITGPAARGDGATLDRHRRALLEMAPELAPTVESLWRETRRQTQGQAQGQTRERR